jgi:hypothetical protein
MGRDVRQLRPLPLGSTSDDLTEGLVNLYMTGERLADLCADGTTLGVVRCQSVQVLSDKREKTQISEEPLDPEESLRNIVKMQPRRYVYKASPDDPRQGLISQEVDARFVRVDAQNRQRILLYDLVTELVSAVKAIEARFRDIPPQVKA